MNNYNDNIKGIVDLTITDNNDFKGLVNFFKDIIASECDYVATIAPRCFALQNIFMQYLNEKNKHIISDQALLLYAERFALQYECNKEFPKVLLVDDLLTYGGNIAYWLYNFEQSIRKELMKLRGINELSENEKFYIHRDFMDAINIYVYATSIVSLTYPYIYRRQVKNYKEKYNNEINVLSQNISSFIKEAYEPNTDYRLSLSVPTASLQSLINDAHFTSSFERRYRGELRRIYVLDDCKGSKFVPFVYTHGEECFNSNNNTLITGISVGGNIKTVDFEKICETTIKILNDAHEGKGKEKYKFLTKLLEQKEKEMQSQRAKFISFILSVINIHDFFNTIGFNISYAKTSDNLKYISHISDNFGLYKDLKDCFSTIVFDTELIANLKTALYQYFKTYPSELAGENIIPTSAEKNQNDKIINYIEEVFQQLGMDADKESFDIYSHEKRFDPKKTSADIIPLNTWLDKINMNLLKEENTPISLYSNLAYFIAIIDSGLATLNFSYNSNTETISCMVQAGELSTFSILRKIHWFIPALVYIEKNNYGTGYTTKQVIEKFIKHLSTYKPEDAEYEKYAIAAENIARQYLIKYGQTLTNWLYDTQKAFRCFEGEILTYSDFREENQANSELNYYRFLMRNPIRRELYVEEAKRFMRKI